MAAEWCTKVERRVKQCYVLDGEMESSQLKRIQGLPRMADVNAAHAGLRRRKRPLRLVERQKQSLSGLYCVDVRCRAKRRRGYVCLSKMGCEREAHSKHWTVR